MNFSYSWSPFLVHAALTVHMQPFPCSCRLFCMYAALFLFRPFPSDTSRAPGFAFRTMPEREVWVLHQATLRTWRQLRQTFQARIARVAARPEDQAAYLNGFDLPERWSPLCDGFRWQAIRYFWRWIDDLQQGNFTYFSMLLAPKTSQCSAD